MPHLSEMLPVIPGMQKAPVLWLSDSPSLLGLFALPFHLHATVNVNECVLLS